MKAMKRKAMKAAMKKPKRFCVCGNCDKKIYGMQPGPQRIVLRVTCHAVRWGDVIQAVSTMSYNSDIAADS